MKNANFFVIQVLSVLQQVDSTSKMKTIALTNAGIRVHFKHSDICRIKISWSEYPRMSILRKEEENFSRFTHLYKQRHTKM